MKFLNALSAMIVLAAASSVCAHGFWSDNADNEGEQDSREISCGRLCKEEERNMKHCAKQKGCKFLLNVSPFKFYTDCMEPCYALSQPCIRLCNTNYNIMIRACITEVDNQEKKFTCLNQVFDRINNSATKTARSVPEEVSTTPLVDMLKKTRLVTVPPESSLRN